MVWEYARLEYTATGSTGADTNMDWNANFYDASGVQRWGTDESFDDVKHLNRAGAQGWEVYFHSPRMIGQPLRLYRITYSMRRVAG